jgi:hypothetical protein
MLPPAHRHGLARNVSRETSFYRDPICGIEGLATNRMFHVKQGSAIAVRLKTSIDACTTARQSEKERGILHVRIETPHSEQCVLPMTQPKSNEIACAHTNAQAHGMFHVKHRQIARRQDRSRRCGSAIATSNKHKHRAGSTRTRALCISHTSTPS